jgi:hypothetical protein
LFPEAPDLFRAHFAYLSEEAHRGGIVSGGAKLTKRDDVAPGPFDQVAMLAIIEVQPFAKLI